MFILLIGLLINLIITNARCGEPVTIRIVSSPMGTGSYFFAFKLAEIINKKHSWVKVEAVEGMGAVANIKWLIKNPSAKKNTILNATHLAYDFSKKGLQPFEKGYKEIMGSELKIIFGQYNMFHTFITLDPKIKTINDLIGKRVALPSRAQPSGYVQEWLLKKYGIWEKIKPQFLDFKPGATTLSDGLVDACNCNILLEKPGEYSAIAAFAELLATKNVFLIDSGDPKYLLDLGKEKGIEIVPVNLIGRFNKKEIPQPMTTFYHGVAWVVDESMDEDVIYEVTKMLCKNIEEIRAVHPSMKSMTIKDLANISKEENFHNGAKKFFKEVGLEIGFKGI